MRRVYAIHSLEEISWTPKFMPYINRREGRPQHDSMVKLDVDSTGDKQEQRQIFEIRERKVRSVLLKASGHVA